MTRINTNHLVPPNPPAVGKPASLPSQSGGGGAAGGLTGDRFQARPARRAPTPARQAVQSSGNGWAFDAVVVAMIAGLIVLGIWVGGNMVGLGVFLGWATMALFMLIRNDLQGAWQRFLR